MSRYLEEYDLIGEEQAGFRSGYSTLGDIFSIDVLLIFICLRTKDYSQPLLTIVRLLIIFGELVYGGNFFSIVLMGKFLM